MNQKQLIGWVLAIAAINWGLAVFNMNLVEMILGGPGSILTKVAYLVIGAVGVYKVYYMLTNKKK